MKKYLKYLFLLVLVVTGVSCDESILDVKNPNSVTLNDITQEGAFLSWANGAVYYNGFNGLGTNNSTADSKYVGNVLGDSYFYIAMQYHEVMADVVGISAANNIVNQVGVPDKVTYSDGSSTSNTAQVKTILRSNNLRSKAGINPVYYEWAYMYQMINACNGVLANLDDVKFAGDVPTRAATLRAWAYWWKGWAYSRLGSLYYAGLIMDEFNKTNGNYVSHDAIIAEANKNFDLTIAEFPKITSAADYTTVMSTLIPEFCQVGKGGILTKEQWTRGINSMKARNLLVNKRAKDMSAADWNNVLTLASAGITNADLTFTGRTVGNNYFFSSLTGSVAAQAVKTGSNFWPTQRFIQEFDQTNDKRWSNNFAPYKKVLVDAGATIIYGATHYLVDGGNGMANTAVIGTQAVGAYELFIGVSYEENELMIAEAKINTGDIAGGLASLDKVRTYQGAGMAATTGVVTDAAEAKELVRKERRIALAFRGVSFYDARRVGFLDDASKGGGRKDAVVVRSATSIDEHATITYNFPDYWDVPDDETSLNPNTGSTAVKNPN